jgi:hypothetical protein
MANISKNIKTAVTDISKIIKHSLDNINNILTKRKRKVTYSDLLYLLCMKNYSGHSYDTIVTTMNIDNIVSATKTAFVNKRKLLLDTYITKLNDNILEYIYKDNKQRVFAIDGTNIYMNKTMEKYGFSLSNNKGYCTGLVSGIYDVKNGITVNYKLTCETDERKIFLEQLRYFKKGDIAVYDRGYFSIKLANILYEKGIYFIFRVKKNLKMVKELQATNKNEITTYLTIEKKKIQVRLIRYKIDDENLKGNYRLPEDGYYYICTNLNDDKTINYIQNLYHERWSIETNFKVVKYDMTLSNIKSKNLINIEQDIAINNFVLLLTGFLYSLISQPATTSSSDSKINFKTCLDQVCSNLLYMFIYGNVHYKKIQKIVKILTYLKTVTYINIKNRKFKRIRVKPTSKWGIYGNVHSYK